MSLTKEQILYYIENPLELNNETLDDLKVILEEFPYFQTAHLLYTSNMLHEKSSGFEGQLKFAAAHVNDRTVLYHLLNDYEILKEKKSNANAGLEKTTVDNNRANTEVDYGEGDLIELADDSQMKVEDNEEVNIAERADVLPEESRMDFPIGDIIEQSAYKLEESKPEKSKSLLSLIKEINNRSGERRFSFENKPSGFEEKKMEAYQLPDEPADEDTKVSQGKTELKKRNKSELIDRFVSDKPVISPLDPKIENSYDLSESSTKYDDEFMTETLVRIYVKQGYYKKAINAFKKLSLKYPEKSTYFAEQIEEVRKLLNK